MLQPNIVIMTNLKSFITSKQMRCKRIMSWQFRESIKSQRMICRCKCQTQEMLWCWSFMHKNMEKQYKAGSTCASWIQRAHMHNIAVFVSLRQNLICLDPTCLLGTPPHIELFDFLCNRLNVLMLSLQDAEKRSVKTSTVNHWIHYVSLSVYVTIQNSAFCKIAPQKGRASTKNNSDQRGKKTKQCILSSGPLWVIVLVSLFTLCLS